MAVAVARRFPPTVSKRFLAHKVAIAQQRDGCFFSRRGNNRDARPASSEDRKPRPPGHLAKRRPAWAGLEPSFAPGPRFSGRLPHRMPVFHVRPSPCLSWEAAIERESARAPVPASNNPKNEVLAMNEEVIARNRGSWVPSAAHSTGRPAVHRRHILRRILPQRRTVNGEQSDQFCTLLGRFGKANWLPVRRICCEYSVARVLFSHFIAL